VINNLLQRDSKILYPASLTELFSCWEANREAIIFARGASWLQKQTERLFILPKTLIVLDGIDELKKINRTERHIEIGSMVTLNRLARLGKIVPEAVLLALRHTTTYLLRNSTTIGSCVCKRSTPEPVIASLVALDAKYELRTAQGSRWVSASQFSAGDEKSILEKKECFTRIRIPLEIWDYTHCRDFSAKESGDNGNEFALFLARIQKNILSELRVIFSGQTIFRDRESELTLIGSKLPLDKKTCAAFIDLWKKHLEENESRSEFQKAKLLNFIDSAIRYFAY
jgi:CO/xanthine dehydrogenase FAD-binding subunit